MSYDLILGAYTLTPPDRDGVNVEAVPIGAYLRTLSGGLRVDMTCVKRRVTLRWGGLSSVQRDVVYAAWVATLSNSQNVQLPDGTPLTVVGATSCWSEVQFYDFLNLPYYDVTLTLEEV